MILHIALILLTAGVAARAQNTDKKETEKTQTTTVDAWRDAVPLNEQPPVTAPPVVIEESKDNVEGEEQAEQTKKRILDLERRLMEALKGRDSVSLNHLLADDFMSAGVNVSGSQPDKAGFIDWALKNSELKSYALKKIIVRVYENTAIATSQYKRQAMIAGAPSEGNFIVTDVWVKRGKLWQAVSHHISQLPKP